MLTGMHTHAVGGALGSKAWPVSSQLLTTPHLQCDSLHALLASLAVTASQVPGSGGALALYLLPRFLLINALNVPIQYKQQASIVLVFCVAGGAG